SRAAVTVPYTTDRGRCSVMPACAATRAARAHTRSVSASVRTSRGARAATTATVAPARSMAPASSASAARRPAVEPSETSRTSVTSRLADVGPVQGLQLAPEPRHAHELDGADRRGSLDIVAHAVALLDRQHRAVLVAPGERPDEREP